MEKILITGVNGMLGQALVKALSGKNLEVIGTSKGASRIAYAKGDFRYYEADVTDKTELQKIFSAERPSVVIHTAAMAQADDCEMQKELCAAININGTIKVSEVAANYNCFFIYLSTDFVFDGEKGMYREEDECHPVNWYGETKRKAEQYVQQARMPWSIVRTCLAYGEKIPGVRNNIVTWVDEKLAAGEPIKVVDDQQRTPTYAGDLVKGIISIVERKANGIFHLSGEEIMTPYQMAIAIARYRNYNELLIERVTADSFIQPAKRPAKTGFVINKAKRELSYQPITFSEGLIKVLG